MHGKGFLEQKMLRNILGPTRCSEETLLQYPSNMCLVFTCTKGFNSQFYGYLRLKGLKLKESTVENA